MTTKQQLSSAEHHFFNLVSETAFCNPFSAQRTMLDQQLASLTKSSAPNFLQAAIQSVAEQIGVLERRGKANLALFADQDRESLKLALLFSQYHYYMDAFDELIQEQIKQGDEPCPVPFSGELLENLRNYGLKAQEARHYLAFFYQLRRAFFFIGKLAGESPALRRLRCALWNNVFTFDCRRYEQNLWDRMEDFSTLLLGETGTGKGAAAAAIGRSGFIPFNEKTGRFSESFTRNFISINLSQYPEALIESELFGHKKGAFTGAIDNHMGIFSRCVPYGTIFLDEIGDVSVPVQIKLLRVLQERVFSPVGSHATRPFRGRIVAATNRPLAELRQAGNFRDDFYYRLCSDVIEVPSLRQQLKEDKNTLDQLLEHLLPRILGSTDQSTLKLIRTALETDLPPDYRWPGNVRELEQAVRRILLNGRYQGDPYAAPEPADSPEPLLDSVDAQQLMSRYCQELYRKFGTYEEVARRSKLDRRTVKKYIQEQ